MKIGILTSSRADYGIYQPLLRRLHDDPSFDLELIVFGTHLSQFHGYTIQEIMDDGFAVSHKLESLVLGDSDEAISSAMALTAAKFSGLWASVKKKYDLIFCLGDRYEMFAAVSAGIPFNLKFAHIHGGEETTGAIDNVFRHAITHMAAYHFTTTKRYKNRVLELLGSSNVFNKNVFNVGSLSLDNLQDIQLLNLNAFKGVYGIDLSKPTILFTFHPETVEYEANADHITEIKKALTKLVEQYQIIITMPNADTMGSLIRDSLQDFGQKHAGRAFVIESLGTKGYFSCMKHVSLLMGNSSSGIIEAASFEKYVINLGDRQKGRTSGKNVLDIAIKEQEILTAVKQIEKKPALDGENMYWNGGGADQIMDILKKRF